MCGNAAQWEASRGHWEHMYGQEFWDDDAGADNVDESDGWQRDLTCDGDVEANPGPEAIPDWLQMKRLKQVEIGKATKGYSIYLDLVPVRHREPGNPNHPSTPRVDEQVSRRSWTKGLVNWRRQLHRWDVMDVLAWFGAAEALLEVEQGGPGFGTSQMMGMWSPIRGHLWVWGGNQNRPLWRWQVRPAAAGRRTTMDRT